MTGVGGGAKRRARAGDTANPIEKFCNFHRDALQRARRPQSRAPTGGMSDEVVQFPKSSIRQVAPTLVVDWDIDYRKSLRDRAFQLAPHVWMATSPPPRIDWNEANRDPKMQDNVARCLATCEMIVRLIDVINSPIGQ